MKKKIAILGSTGSIGKTLLDIVSQNESEFEKAFNIEMWYYLFQICV